VHLARFILLISTRFVLFGKSRNCRMTVRNKGELSPSPSQSLFTQKRKQQRRLGDHSRMAVRLTVDCQP
jgi:hypothetical protein